MFPEQDEFIVEMYRDLYSSLFKFALKYLKNEELTKEIVHDVFLEAMEQCDNLMEHPKPEGWMMRTLQYKMANYSRKTAKMKRQTLSMNGETVIEIISTEVTEDKVVQIDGLREAQEKIEKSLSDEEKFLIRRFAFEGASHAEIARELRITEWTSQKRLERIRDKLYKQFPGHRKKQKRKQKDK